MDFFDFIIKVKEMEQFASKMYREIADAAQLDVKKVATRFSEEEEKHAKAIEEIMRLYDQRDVALSERSYLLLQSWYDKRRQFDPSEFTTMKDFFKFGLQGEKDSVLLYEEIIKSFPEDSTGYSLITKLIEEEKKHMYYLLKQLHQ